MKSPHLDEPAGDTLLGRLSPVGLLSRGLLPPRRSASRTGESSHLDNLETATPDARLESLFPEYHFEQGLSRGGFGAVYQVLHRQRRRREAIKILHAGSGEDTAAVARFEREMTVMAGLDHPGIVRVFDAGRRGHVWFLAMEFVAGIDFAGLVRTHGPLGTAEAAELVRQAARALHEVHHRGWVHRDIKPTNLMLADPAAAPELAVKLLDFGLARLRHESDRVLDLTVSSEFLGTVDYVAPEQIRHPARVDHRADLYGLGATLYWLLTGRSPHDHADAPSASLYTKILRIADEPAPSIRTHRPDVDPRVGAIVDRLLSRDPADRPASAADLADALSPHAVGAELSSVWTRVSAGLPTSHSTGASRHRRLAPNRPSCLPGEPRLARHRRWVGATLVALALTTLGLGRPWIGSGTALGASGDTNPTRNRSTDAPSTRRGGNLPRPPASGSAKKSGRLTPTGAPHRR